MTSSNDFYEKTLTMLSLRFPRIHALRPDKSVADIDTVETVTALYEGLQSQYSTPISGTWTWDTATNTTGPTKHEVEVDGLRREIEALREDYDELDTAYEGLEIVLAMLLARHGVPDLLYGPDPVADLPRIIISERDAAGHRTVTFLPDFVAVDDAGAYPVVRQTSDK